MLEIKFDVTKLNNEERQDLASFILGWPERIDPRLKLLESLNRDYGKMPTTPCQSEGILRDPPIHVDDNPFAPEPSPLPAGATAAPMSAGVEVLTTAPVDIPATTSSIPPTPASVPPAPSSANVAETAAPPQASPVELDSEGLPWDSRIHSSSRGKIANGTWKLVRGSDPARVEAVKSELRALMAVPVNSAVIPPSPVNTDQSVIAPPKSHYLIDQPGAVIPPIPTPIRHGFVDFIEDITQRLVSKKLTQADILKACTDAGIAAPNLLATRPDLIPQVARALDAIA